MNRQCYLYNHDRRVVAYPPSYGSAGSFLVHFVAQQKGSSKSVANVLSNLRVLCARAETPWLSFSDMVRISQLIRQLKFDGAVEVKRSLFTHSQSALYSLEGQRIYVRLLGGHYYSSWSRRSSSW
jgi:hypothetical protein